MYSHHENDNQKSFPATNSIPDNEQSLNVGKWTSQENLKYAIFMDFHKITLSSKQKKKNFRVFEEMSAFIGSRNTVQCRSHHQKLEQRFKHFKKIISAVKHQVGRKDYKLQYKKWTNSGSQLVFEASKLKEKHDLTNSSDKKDEIKLEQVGKVAKVKTQETTYSQMAFPFLNYSPFPNPYPFSIPGFYPFTIPFFG